MKSKILMKVVKNGWAYLVDKLSMAKFRLSKLRVNVDETLSGLSFNGYKYHIKRDNNKILLELYKQNKWSLPLYMDDEMVRVLLQPNRHLLHNIFPISFIILVYYGNKLFNYLMVVRDKVGATK